jgi:hypothetical protein
MKTGDLLFPWTQWDQDIIFLKPIEIPGGNAHHK